MILKYLYIKETSSTNVLLKQVLKNEYCEEGFLIYTDFQTSGKGQMGNFWESQHAKNLLFSTVIFPMHIAIDQQFIISQMISLAIVKALENYADGFKIKWPNDIYWNNKKIGGILIENTLQGNKIKSSIIGIGLNINQKLFTSNAPNPVSLIHITGKSTIRKKLLKNIWDNFEEIYKKYDVESIKVAYFKYLYRNDGYYFYNENGFRFKAKISHVHSDGMLDLENEAGETKSYYFKEVEYLI